MKKIVMMLCAAVMLVATGAWAASSLTVEDVAVGTGVVDRVLSGSSDKFSAEVGDLVCFTRVMGAAEGDSIKHRWYRGGKLMADISLDVKPGRWRTWSEKSIPVGATGEWKVEIVGPDGLVLKTVDFKVE